MAAKRKKKRGVRRAASIMAAPMQYVHKTMGTLMNNQGIKHSMMHNTMRRRRRKSPKGNI
jgi:hypothetical protein